MRVLRLIGFRIFILITLLMLILTTTVTLIHINYQQLNYEKLIADFGNRVSELIRASTHKSMLANFKEDTYHIIDKIAEQKGIEKIRIYNKQGTIVFSTSKEEKNKTVDMKNESCFMCHPSENRILTEPQTADRIRIFEDTKKERFLGVVASIKNEKSCWDSECHYHEPDQKILGTFDVILSLKESDEIIAEEKASLLRDNFLITLVMALSAGTLLFFLVHIPVRKLTEATRQISAGNLDHKISLSMNDEMKYLAEAFNKMTEELKVAQEEITAWSDELESRVKSKTEELKKTQQRIVQIEKMASLGKLSATVAHELNNPLAGILTYSKLIQRKLNKEYLDGEERQTILKNLKMIESESERCGNIIKNLLVFSKKERVEKRLNDLNTLIDNSLMLVEHHLKINNIRLEKNLEENLPEVNVDGNQIKQALLALLLNSVEAIERDGLIVVESHFNKLQKQAVIAIKDNGKGMSAETQSRIFEPFFTTKHEGKGVGLGLSIVYGIIENHEGKITVDSEENKGAEFKIYLPIN